MTTSSTTAKVLAIALLLALAVVCLGDFAEAFMPHNEHAGCVSRFCDAQTGCPAAGPGPVALPPATLAIVEASVGLAAPVFVLPLVEPPPKPYRQVVTVAPRSPPAA